jgi:hypothetical protein
VLVVVAAVTGDVMVVISVVCTVVELTTVLVL